MRRVRELKTPVNDKRRNAARKETFPGRLDWKQQRFGVPVTSTPKPDLQQTNKNVAVADGDLRNCFGFDESEEENYSALISPIAMMGKPLIPLQKKVTRSNAKAVAVAAMSKKKVDEVSVLQENNNSSKSPESAVIPLVACEEVIITTNKSVTDQNYKLPVEVTDERGEKSQQRTVEKKEVVKRKPTKRKAKGGGVTRKRVAKAITSTKSETVQQQQELYEQDDILSSQMLVADVSGVVDSEVETLEPDNVVFIKRDNNGMGTAGFNALLARYGNADDDDSDAELHIDAEKIKKTYSSGKLKGHHSGVPKPTKKAARKQSCRARKSAKGVQPDPESSDSDSSDGLDIETKKWLEQKNKEFDDVLNVPLVFASSASTKPKHSTVRRSTRTCRPVRKEIA